MTSNTTATPSKEANKNMWTAPVIQIARTADAKADLSLQNFDGVLYQASAS